MRLRLKSLSLLVGVLLVMLLIPAASADICNGCPLGGPTPSGVVHRFSFLSITNAFDGGPFASKTQTVEEGDICTFTVRRHGSTKRAASVRYFTEDGTATAGDYVPVEQDSEGNSVHFARGARTGTIKIGTFDQEDDRGPETLNTIETFTVHLFNAHHARIRRGVGECDISENPKDF